MYGTVRGKRRFWPHPVERKRIKGVPLKSSQPNQTKRLFWGVFENHVLVELGVVSGYELG